MPIEIIVPRLGWSMEEGSFVRWLKKDGETVNAGELLFALESDKATQEIESMDAGVLCIPPDAPQPGSTVKVGQRLAYLLTPGEPDPGAKTSAPIPAQQDQAPRTAPGPQATQEAKKAQGPDESSPEPPAPPDAPVSSLGENAQEKPAGRSSLSSHPAVSPRAARVARDLGVDWTRVAGSGRTGRIRERDIRAAARTGPPSASLGSVVTAVSAGSDTLSVTRRTIAERMMTSLRNTAPVTLTMTSDVTLLVQLRDQWKAEASGAGPVVPSYTDLLMKLCAAALKRHPALAARWEGERVVRAEAIHIGLAVDTDAGLLVPVIHDVTQLSLRDIAMRSRDLIERARARKLTSQELRGGVFTVTSLGAFGIDMFTPIINYPECAILGIGQIRREPAAAGDQIVLRHRVAFSLTFDHRAMDGATAARFLETLRKLLDSPAAHLGLEA